MPNVMAAQPNIGAALCESSVILFLVPRRKVLLTPAAAVTCSNAAKTRKPLKVAGVPQTPEMISWAEVHHIVETCGGHIAVSDCQYNALVPKIQLDKVV